MTRFETIIQDALALPATEREELVRLLLSRLSPTDDNDAGVGVRGLAAWAEVSQEEDWSVFYPPSLVNGRKGEP
jgi:hypothetical protein